MHVFTANKGVSMNIKDIRISVRLAVCFAVLIGVMCVITGIALKSLDRVEKSTAEIVEDRYQKIALASDISDNVNGAVRSLRDALLGRTPEESAKYTEQGQAFSAKTGKALAQIEKLLTSPRDKDMLKMVMDARNAYTPSRDKLRELIKQNKKEEGTELLFKEVVPVQDKYLKALDDFVAYQKTMMDESVVQGKQTASSATSLMLLLSGAAILICVAAAWLVTRSITGPLNQAVSIAGAVAQGDLTVRIEATTKDETGTLLASLKSMNENLHRIVTQVRQGTDAITTASKESPAATWTCPRAPKSRPARWKKPPRPWKS